ncbi:MAG: hypothetical protein ABIG95_06765 [Candidatus Woesearchaeota archaeon]
MAIGKELQDWIERCLNKGYSKDKIKKKLLGSGYSQEDIKQIFKDTEKNTTKSKLIAMPLIMPAVILIIVLFLVGIMTQSRSKPEMIVDSNNPKFNTVTTLDKPDSWEQEIVVEGGVYNFTLVAKAKPSEDGGWIMTRVEPFVREMRNPDGSLSNRTISQVFKRSESYFFEKYPEERWPHISVKLDDKEVYNTYVKSEEFVPYSFSISIDTDGPHTFSIELLNYNLDPEWNSSSSGERPSFFKTLSVKEVRYK